MTRLNEIALVRWRERGSALTFDLRAVIDLHGLLCCQSACSFNWAANIIQLTPGQCIRSKHKTYKQPTNTNTHSSGPQANVFWPGCDWVASKLAARLWLDGHANGRKVAFYNFAISAAAQHQTENSSLAFLCLLLPPVAASFLMCVNIFVSNCELHACKFIPYVWLYSLSEFFFPRIYLFFCVLNWMQTFGTFHITRLTPILLY